MMVHKTVKKVGNGADRREVSVADGYIVDEHAVAPCPSALVEVC
ncbi:MAG: hypothetical protein QXI52_05225 [Nitrososphaerota archaeon]